LKYKHCIPFTIAAVWAVSSCLGADTIEFNRDIRPILSDHCYTCHGPDQSNRKTKLRFDTEDGAKQDLGGHFAIVPRDPAKSEMVARISAGKSPRRMPPAYAGPALSDHDIDLIRRWIAKGAEWQKHWSLIPPRRPETPQVSDAAWVRSPIDAFVLARLDREGLKPSPEADKTTLLRRITLDLTGLPPTPAELNAFLADASPKAYEKVVDRLLASPRYGEKMAYRWLDLARYADTNGYQTDGERYMWRWRDWVIDAFNGNMPFNEFTIEQLAGDMLPNATLDQRIASGFNRNHRGNGEGGIVPEEYAVEYVVDRVDTAASVWIGLTVGCARCHDHKYDPIKQKEFYSLYAYFDNIPERGNAEKYGNSPPVIKAPTAEQQTKLAALDRQIETAEQTFTAAERKTVHDERKWQKRIDASAQWFPPRQLAAWFSLDAAPAAPAKIEGSVTFAPGRIGGAAQFDGHSFVNAGDTAEFGFLDKFSISAWVNASAPNGAIVGRGKDLPESTGYNLVLSNGHVQFDLVLRWLDDSLRVETEDTLPLNGWHHIAATYDGSRYADGVKIYIDGVACKLKINFDGLNQDFRTKEPLRIGGGAGPENRFHGSIDEVRLYKTNLPSASVALLATPQSLRELAAVPPDRRTAAQRDKMHLAWLDSWSPEPVRASWSALEQAHEERDKFYDSIQTVMVMQELPGVRETHLLIRGSYDRPGPKVERGVPAILPPLPAGAPNNRLGLAKWLVDPANPLTARVTVNRFWQSYFGTGIVKTVEDFGSQGEWPSHPELLDWLATEFIRTGWNIKAMQKTIVMSATYRQSSTAPEGLLVRDPENRLLARGPRVRLAAEEVRDQALAASGLLVEKIGGPSVKPYQPAGLWKELSGGADYQQDHGAAEYRRSLYTFWKRAAPPPMMMNFDSAGREMCTVGETRTNTPLQALDLMNDRIFVEAARVLAARMMREGGADASDRIAYGFRLVTTRKPSEKELGVLTHGYEYYRTRFEADAAGALKLVSEGDAPRDPALDITQLAAYTNIASLILNLDEVVTKQ
jgi:hypothetical protein